ncbi:hypothetical protein BZA77DRAFT_369022 [Pyronema omphalodes]|nr:hypothetical protein BZA77DRAFT_369022 [Pyronema omphalodes]
MNEIMGALLELRSMLRKLQWYGELKEEDHQILKKLDKKLEINVQRRYLETKVGGTEGGLDPESAVPQTKELGHHTNEYRREQQPKAPISAPPPSAKTVECDGTLRLLPDDEAVQMLEYILSHLSPSSVVPWQPVIPTDVYPCITPPNTVSWSSLNS